MKKKVIITVAKENEHEKKRLNDALSLMRACE